MSVFEIPPVSSYLFCGWSIILHREYSQAAFLQQSPQRQITSRATPTLPSENVWGKLHSSAFRTCTVKRSICVQKIKFQRSQSVQMNGWKWWNTRGSWLWKSFDSESLGSNGLQQPLRSSLLTSQWSSSASLLVACGPLWMELANQELVKYAAEEPRLYALVHEPGELPPRGKELKWLDLQNCTSWLLVFDFKFQSRWSSPRQYHSWLYDDCGTGATGIFATQYYHLIPTGSPETAVLCWPPVLHFLSAVPRQFGPQYNVSGATWQLASSWSCHTKLIKNPGCQSDQLCFTSFNPMSWTAQITL